METKTRYFVLPGRYNSGNPLLIKFDGDRQYWYCDNQNWILGTSLLEEHWLDGHLTPIVVEERKRMIEEESEIVFKNSKIQIRT